MNYVLTKEIDISKHLKEIQYILAHIGIFFTLSIKEPILKFNFGCLRPRPSACMTYLKAR